MLYKWKSDAVAGVFSTVGTIPGFGGQGYQSQLDHHKDSEKQADNDDDDEDDNTPNPACRNFSQRLDSLEMFFKLFFCLSN